MGFDAFLGNPQAVSAAREMLARRRVPGALLFAGPDGVGKKTLALMLAKALNCERRKDDFCGECPRCKKAEMMLDATREDLAQRRAAKDASKRAEGLVYFDLQLIEPLTRYILIEQVRQLRAVAYAHPFEFLRRAVILDQAQTLHWQAVDLLLKVLEEPPPSTTIILVCPNAHELRATIRSRCRLIRFLPVEDAIISKILAEEKCVPAGERALALRVAAGSLARARALDLAEFQSRRRPWLDFLDVVARQESASSEPPNWSLLFEATRALSAERDTFEETLKIGYSLLRDLSLILHDGPAAQLVNVDVLPRLKGWAPSLGFAGIERLLRGLDQARRLQIRNVNQQLGLDALAADLLEEPAALQAGLK